MPERGALVLHEIIADLGRTAAVGQPDQPAALGRGRIGGDARLAHARRAVGRGDRLHPHQTLRAVRQQHRGAEQTAAVDRRAAHALIQLGRRCGLHDRFVGGTQCGIHALVPVRCLLRELAVCHVAHDRDDQPVAIGPHGVAAHLHPGAHALDGVTEEFEAFGLARCRDQPLVVDCQLFARDVNRLPDVLAQVLGLGHAQHLAGGLVHVQEARFVRVHRVHGVGPGVEHRAQRVRRELLGGERRRGAGVERRCGYCCNVAGHGDCFRPGRRHPWYRPSGPRIEPPAPAGFELGPLRWTDRVLLHTGRPTQRFASDPWTSTFPPS